MPGALASSGKGFGNVMHVGQEERRCIDEHRAVGILGVDGEAGEDGVREGLAHDGLRGGIVGGGAELLIGLHEEQLRPGALEVDEGATGDLAAVEADVVGPHAVREGVV